MIEIAICDDSEDDISAIRKYLKEFMKEKKIIYSIYIYMAGEDLLIADRDFDIIFLDIAMGPGINGIVTGKKFRSISRETKIIYISSFNQYFEQAINNVHAFAYLEKPIHREILMKQLEDVMEFVGKGKRNKQIVTFEVIDIAGEHGIDTTIRDFDVDEIYYFEYINRRIRIKTKNGDFYFIGQMKKLIDRMSQYTYESCHQSYLINLKYVKRIKGYDLYMRNEDRIPVSQKRSSDFREKLNKFIQVNT